MKLKTRTNQPVYYKLPVSSNMEQLSDGMLNSLKVGDVVQKKTGEQKHCYIVTYKEEKHGICLSYFDCGYLETISYDYTNGHWVFNSKDVIEVPSMEDITSMLIGKYVRIMVTPSSTGSEVVLTDEQIAQIMEGCFIEGMFLGIKNPIFYPTDEDQTAPDFICGIMIGIDRSYPNRPHLVTYEYEIDKATKVIKKVYKYVDINIYAGGQAIDLVDTFNKKSVPKYPANTGTFTLKCVNGTLTWVADE